VRTKWHKEISTHNPNAIIILVGTKSELRDEMIQYDKYWTYFKKNTNRMTRDMGEKLQKQINAVAYVEVSAKKNSGIDQLTNTIVKTLQQNRKSIRDKLLRMSLGKLEGIFGATIERIESIYESGKESLRKSLTE
jgi:GTPase SAR1 family protein